MLKKLIILSIIPIQIIIILLTPRFGWQLATHHNPEGTRIYKFERAIRDNGYTRAIYTSNIINESTGLPYSRDIVYRHRFSRNITVVLDDGRAQDLHLLFDAAGAKNWVQNPEINFTTEIGADIFRNDSSGFLFRVYFLAIGLAAAGVFVFWITEKKLLLAAFAVLAALVSFRLFI